MPTCFRLGWDVAVHSDVAPQPFTPDAAQEEAATAVQHTHFSRYKAHGHTPGPSIGGDERNPELHPGTTGPRTGPAHEEICSAKVASRTTSSIDSYKENAQAVCSPGKRGVASSPGGVGPGGACAGAGIDKVDQCPTKD